MVSNACLCFLSSFFQKTAEGQTKVKVREEDFCVDKNIIYRRTRKLFSILLFETDSDNNSGNNDKAWSKPKLFAF